MRGLATSSAILLLVVAGVVLIARSDGADVQRPVLLVSGRDDHGLLATATVALLEAPHGAAVAEVADGTLVAVTATRAEWLQVRALEGPSATGWIHDFYLRGTVHVVGDPPGCPVPLVGKPGGAAFDALRPSEQVELLDVHETEGEVWVAVRTLGEDSPVGLVPRTWVRELALESIPADVACPDTAIEPEASPHRH